MFNRSVNKVVLVGNVGKDPEIKFLPNGNAVANFSIATTESWKNKQTGEYENETEWHNLTVYGKFGELCGEYIKKGAKVYVEGKLKTRKWQDKTTGQDKYATDVIVSELQMMDGKSDSSPKQMQQEQSALQQAPQMAPAYQQAPPPPQQALTLNEQSWLTSVKANPALINEIQDSSLKAKIQSLI